MHRETVDMFHLVITFCTLSFRASRVRRDTFIESGCEVLKKLFRMPLVLAVLLCTVQGCSTVDANVAARKNLMKCRYAMEDIKLIKLERKGISLRAVQCDIFLRITNASDSDVMLDRIEGRLYLDDKAAGTFQHRRSLRVAQGSSVVERFRVRVPFVKAVRAISALPDNLRVDADVYINLIIGSATVNTPFKANVSRSFKIPYR